MELIFTTLHQNANLHSLIVNVQQLVTCQKHCILLIQSLQIINIPGNTTVTCYTCLKVWESICNSFSHYNNVKSNKILAFSLVSLIKLAERSNIAQVSLIHSLHLLSWLAQLSESPLINACPQASRGTQKALDGLRSLPLEFASLSLIKELFDTSNESGCELPESVHHHISKLR